MSPLSGHTPEPIAPGRTASLGFRLPGDVFQPISAAFPGLVSVTCDSLAQQMPGGKHRSPQAQVPALHFPSIWGKNLPPFPDNPTGHLKRFLQVLLSRISSSTRENVPSVGFQKRVIASLFRTFAWRSGACAFLTQCSGTCSRVGLSCFPQTENEAQVRCASFPFSLSRSLSPPPPGRAPPPAPPPPSHGCALGVRAEPQALVSVGCAGTGGLSAGKPLRKPGGLRGLVGWGKRPTTSATENKKRGRTKPQSGTTFSNATETSKPCERLQKKTKSNCPRETGPVPVRQDRSEREGEPWLLRTVGQAVRTNAMTRACPSGDQGWM